MPGIVESLPQANCDPNHFGHPPKSPLNEAVLRNSLATVRLLVGWRANVNLQARGNDLPLSCAVRQQRPEMVKCLLELRLTQRLRATLLQTLAQGLDGFSLP